MFQLFIIEAVLIIIIRIRLKYLINPSVIISLQLTHNSIEVNSELITRVT